MRTEATFVFLLILLVAVTVFAVFGVEIHHAFTHLNLGGAQ